MQPIKVDRKDLQQILIDVLKQHPSFQLIEGINPCKILLDGIDFFIYTKNLSPAQLSNSNPDIWRIQLPIRGDFDELKNTDIPFIILGYDANNEIYTTWNPYWVKQRLNVAKSVSLYSRLSLQQAARVEQDFRRMSLNNEGEVIAFPQTKLYEYLSNYKIFFPQETNYVAMGSRKRIEANDAYRILTDTKNINDFAHYLVYKNIADITVNNYCRAIKRLINDGMFSQNRRIFLACDSLEEYPNVIKEFMSVPQIAEINEVYHNTYSAALHHYIQFLLEINNLNEEEESIDRVNEEQSQIYELFPENEVEIDDDDESVTEDENPLPDTDNTDWEAMFTDDKGKLTRIANPALIDLLRPVLDVEYRKIAAAYNIISQFYGSRFTNELKDWDILINNIDWNNPYYTPSQISKQGTKQKSVIIKITTPEGDIMQHTKVLDTLIDVIEYAGAENVMSLNIQNCGDNLILQEDNINERYRKATKQLSSGLYVNTCSDTKTKARTIQQISDSLELDLKIEIVDFDKQTSVPISYSKTSNRQKIRVIFPNGKIIQHNIVSDTFIEVIQYAGVQNVRNLKISHCGDNLIVTKENINPKYAVATKPLGNDMYVNTNISTLRKAEILKQISDELHLHLIIEID